MRFSTQAIFLVLALCAVLDHTTLLVAAKKPSRSSQAARRSRPSSSRSSSSSRPAVSKRRYEEEEEDDYGAAYDDDDDDYEEEEEEEYKPRSRPAASRKGGSRSSSRKRPSRGRYEEDYEDDYDRPRRPPSGGRRGRGPPPGARRGPPGRRGNVVPYTRQKAPSTFTRGLTALKNSMPDPTTVKNAAVSSLNVARETTSNLSSNLYREVKGLTSSELEQVMLKATRPDDTAVKGKHVERLVGVTYQISSRYDIYDAVLRKLWSKMAEKDWRTTIKALYILHRFSADGAPEHAPALKVCFG